MGGGNRAIPLLQNSSILLEHLKQIPQEVVTKEQDEDGRTSLHHAISLGHPISVVSYLCSIFPTPLVKDDANWTPLHIASTKKRLDYIQLLLSSIPPDSEQSKEFINYQTNTGQTALHYCASKGFTDGIKALVDAGANGAIRDNIGMMPVHRAVSAGQLEAVKLLINPPESKVPSTDNSGNTLLHLAVENQYQDIIKYLMHNFRALVDVTAENKEKETPLSLTEDYPDIGELLKFI